MPSAVCGERRGVGSDVWEHCYDISGKRALSFVGIFKSCKFSLAFSILSSCVRQVSEGRAGAAGGKRWLDVNQTRINTACAAIESLATRNSGLPILSPSTLNIDE